MEFLISVLQRLRGLFLAMNLSAENPRHSTNHLK